MSGSSNVCQREAGERLMRPLKKGGRPLWANLPRIFPKGFITTCCSLVEMGRVVLGLRVLYVFYLQQAMFC